MNCQALKNPIKIIRNCIKCNKQFQRYPSCIKSGRGKYCSVKCSKSGIIFSQDRKNNISIARKNKLTGPDNPRWNGGKKSSRGYIMISMPNHPFKNNHGYVFEHRLVMEKHIGRYLHPKEVVHHTNNIKHDNRIENLILFKNTPTHLGYHRYLKKLNNYILAKT